MARYRKSFETIIYFERELSPLLCADGVVIDACVGAMQLF